MGSQETLFAKSSLLDDKPTALGGTNERNEFRSALNRNEFRSTRKRNDVRFPVYRSVRHASLLAASASLVRRPSQASRPGRPIHVWIRVCLVYDTGGQNAPPLDVSWREDMENADTGQGRFSPRFRDAFQLSGVCWQRNC